VSEEDFSPRVREIIRNLSGDERSMSIALGAIIREADLSGSAPFHNVVIRYRDEFLRVLRTEGKDAEREAGRLGLDEVESYLKASILPRLVGDGVIKASDDDPVTPDLKIQLVETLWREIEPNKREIAEVFRHTGEYSAIEAQKHTRSKGSHKVLQAPGCGQQRRSQASTGRDSRVARAQWCGKDDELLHDRRIDRATGWKDFTRRERHFEHADV
jgi:hypothetical protein